MTAKRINLLTLGLVLVLILGGIGLAVYGERASSGGHENPDQAAEHATMLAAPGEASNLQARLAVRIDPQEGAKVGDAATFAARVTDASGHPVSNVLFTVALWHTEDEKTIFSTSGVGSDGSIAWEFAPHDGVPYEVRVTAAPTAQSSVQFAPLSVKPVVFFEPLAPPLRVKLLNTFYLVGVVTLGVATGLWLAARRAATGERARPRPVIRPGLAGR